MRLLSQPTGARSRLGIVLALLALAAPGTASAGDWPQFHRSADRSAFDPSETTLGAGNLSQLGARWRTSLGNALVTAPVVAGNTVYVGSSDGKLYALDAENGAIRWSAAAGESVVRAPAVDGGRVFVGSESGQIFAFPTSCSTPCEPLWATSTAGRISSAPAAGASPAAPRS